MKAELYWNLKINPTCAVAYPERAQKTFFRCDKYIDENLAKGRIQNKSKGVLSQGAVKRMRNSINLLIASSTQKKLYSKKMDKKFNFKLSFITLTLSDDQQHSDKEIYNLLLKPFLQYLKDAHSVVNYIWKAETQKNGRLHYHIIINRFIHYDLIRKAWNRLQLNNGYLDNYYKKYKNFNAPSTEIKGVKKINNIGAYFVKYLVKNQSELLKPELYVHRDIFKNGKRIRKKSRIIKVIFDNEKHFPVYKLRHKRRLVVSRLWGCSYNLSKKIDSIMINEHIRLELERLVKSKVMNVKNEDYFSIYYYRFEDLIKDTGYIRSYLMDFISSLAVDPDEILNFEYN